jgi:hypothetical protein
MSTKFKVELYSQLELNNVAFRRDGRIEAQCALDPASFSAAAPAENGMLLAVDKKNGLVKLPTDDSLPIGLNYTAEHMYDERKKGLRNFCLTPEDGFYPRIGYLAVGDTFTTNCLCHDMADDDAMKTAVAGTATVYGGIDASGRILVSTTKPTAGPVLLAVKGYSMPNGEYGVKFQVVSC